MTNLYKYIYFAWTRDFNQKWMDDE